MQRVLYLENSSSVTALAEACFSLTPKVSQLSERELYLEVASTCGLFGGEAGMLLRAHKLFVSFGAAPRLVLTDRPEWAKAFATSHEVLVPPGKSQARLLSLPIERLALCGDPFKLEERTTLLTFLKKVGLRKIGDFTRLPAPAVIKRFGQKGAELRAWALGEKEISLPLFAPEEKLTERIDTEEIASLESLLFYLRKLLVRLECRLHGRAQAARALLLIFYLDSGQQLERWLQLAEPMRDPQALLRVLRDFLSTLTWNSPLLRLEVTVTDAVTHSIGQLSLFDDKEQKFHELAQFVTRLRSRYGELCVGTPELCESHYPESAWRNQWPPPRKVLACEFPNRPLFLYDPPKPCTPDRRWRLIPLENIDCEWWANRRTRAYFLAESDAEASLWIFFEPKTQRWFLHGVFD